MSKIIGLAGQAGSGKSSVAACLNEAIPYSGVFAFADDLKLFCTKVFGWKQDRCFGPSDMRRLADEDGLTARMALQSLGDWGRGLRQDVWIDMLFRQIELERFATSIISDVRFVNEAKRIKEAGGCVLLFVGRGCVKRRRLNWLKRMWHWVRGRREHQSETECLTPAFRQYVDAVIDNSGSMEETMAAVEEAIAEWCDKGNNGEGAAH